MFDNTSLAVKAVLAGRDRVETEAFRGGYPFRAEFCAPAKGWVRMLRLMEAHPAAAVERAVRAALERHSPRLETVRLILRQQEAGPPPVCPPVTGVRPELARIAVPAATLLAYGALVEGAR